MSKLVLSFVGLSGLILASCNNADFYGGGRSGKLPDAAPSALSCSINPGEVGINDQATITVSGPNNFSGPVSQSIVFDGQKTDSKLSGSEGTFTKEGGAANSFTPTKEGRYVVELRKDGSDAIDGTCEFVVVKESQSIDPTDPSQCESPVGAHVAFLIDNSNSNAETDCANPTQIGQHNGATLYQCQAATNREKAVLTAFDILETVAANKPDREEAKSDVSIGSFPTQDDFMNGWAESVGWLEASAGNRSQIEDVLSFTRKPFGLTPYGVGVDAANSMFGGLGSDEKAKVVVLVTDGEPTDRDPSAVSAAAEQLRSKGVEVITVFVTGSATRTARRSEHTEMMQKIDTNYMNYSGNHWYNTSVYNSFNTYVDALLGTSGQNSLAENITSKIDETCQDTSSSKCARRIVEVEDSSALNGVFSHIIKTRAIRCED